MDRLDSHGDLAEDPHLVAGKAKLAVLEVRHLQAKVLDEVEVNQGRCRDWKMRRYKTSKWSSFDTKDVFLFLIWIPVTQSRIHFRAGHHFQYSIDFDLVNVVGSFSQIKLD
jgi:hypothetical protein